MSGEGVALKKFVFELLAYVLEVYVGSVAGWLLSSSVGAADVLKTPVVHR